MRTLHIVLPMAGRGSRFANAGFTIPKPLITVDNMPMFLKALKSFDNIKVPKKYTIIIRKEHDIEQGLGKLLKEKLPEANIIITDEEPIGATADAYRCKQTVKPNEGVVILDCDLYFQSESYAKMVTEALNDKSSIVGGLLTFTSSEPRYSYAEVGSDGYVTRTAEKDPISDRAITGAYFFSRAKNFFAAAEALLAKPIDENMKEYYTSLLYNILIEQGGKVLTARSEVYDSFGTPEELSAYEAAQNQPASASTPTSG